MLTAKERSTLLPSDIIRSGWTQGYFAKLYDGETYCHYCDADACYWCAIGAIDLWHSYGRTISIDLRDMYVDVLSSIVAPHHNDLTPCKRIVHWNDSKDTTQQMVIDAMEETEKRLALRH